MGEPYKFTAEKRDRFLGCLRAGMRRGHAARRAGVQRQTVSNYAKQHPEFSAAIEQCELEAAELVEDALLKKALEGNTTACIFWLTNANPEKWRDRRGQPVIIAQENPGVRKIHEEHEKYQAERD